MCSITIFLWVSIMVVTVISKSEQSVFFLFHQNFFSFFFKSLFIYFQREGKGRREKKRNIHVWLPFTHPLLGTWPATQACALTGNQTSDPVVYRPVLNPLSYTSQGTKISYTRAENCFENSKGFKGEILFNFYQS